MYVLLNKESLVVGKNKNLISTISVFFLVCEILFGIFNYCNGEMMYFLIINLTILLGKWFLNRS